MDTATFTNLHNLDKCFTDENKCIEHLESQRWKEPFCERCGGLNPYILKAKRKSYKCKECGYKFNVLTGTIFENTKLPLIIWFKAIYIATSHKKGISSLQLHRDLGITQKTAWFVLSRIRELLKEKAPVMLSNTVEIDEAFIGGKEGNKHQSIRSRKDYSPNKTVVFGAVERDGKVVNKVVRSTSTNDLIPVMQHHVAKGSTMVSDDYNVYRSLPNHGYSHFYVKHSIKEYADGIYHTNTIEGYWSLFKRGIYGIYHYASPKHLQRYCDEFTFRYNSRKVTEVERFNKALTQLDESRLRYDDLISNERKVEGLEPPLHERE